MSEGTSKLGLRKTLLYIWSPSNWYCWNTFARKYKQEEAKLHRLFSQLLTNGLWQSRNSITLAKWAAYTMYFWLLWDTHLQRESWLPSPCRETSGVWSLDCRYTLLFISLGYDLEGPSVHTICQKTPFWRGEGEDDLWICVHWLFEGPPNVSLNKLIANSCKDTSQQM